MRNLMMFTATVLLLMSMTFKTPTKKGKNLKQDWTEWISDDCYKGIDYRARKGDYNSYSKKWYWYAQIRNRYNNKVNISYIITEPGERKQPDHRTIIEANSIDGAGEAALLNSSERCHIRVGEIRFGDDDSGPYYNCDK